jgi:hypothetical protein
MTQRTVVQSLQGARIGISAVLPATFDVAGYDVSSLVFTPVGQIESYGNHGLNAAVSEFTPVDTGVVSKVKGSKNYGTMSLVIGNLPSDAGQAILKTASESTAHYSVEVRYQDNEFHYLDVIVTKLEYVDGAVNDVQKINVDLAICRTPVIVPQV